MRSKWYGYKNQAINLRKTGVSMTVIEKKWGIPKSTLSGWFKNIKLTKKQRGKLESNKWKALKKARKKAVLWHNQQKQNRLTIARDQALLELSKIDVNNKNILKLALSFLYLGEGTKNNVTSIGNSNPDILKFFINCLNILYGIKRSDLKCELHLRNDQNGHAVKKYWSNKLGIPINNFLNPVFDKRTEKSKTFSHYKGVCVVRCGRIAILRELVFLSQKFCDKIVNAEMTCVY